MADVASVQFARERLELIEDGEQSTHFWYAPRRALLLDTIARAGVRRDAPLLDAGCGTGALVADLCGHGFDAHGIDPWMTQATAAARHAFSPFDPARFQAGQVESIPWPDASDHHPSPSSRSTSSATASAIANSRCVDARNTPRWSPSSRAHSADHR